MFSIGSADYRYMAVPGSEKKDLISDYCLLGGSAENRLSDIERMTLIGGGDLMKLLQRVSRGHIPINFDVLVRSVDEKLVAEAADYYSGFSDPAKIFKKPSGIITPRIIPVHCLSDEGEISDLIFESSYEGFHGTFDKLKKTIPENNTVNVRYWRHKDTKRPTIIAVHGFAMGDHKSNSLAFLPGLFFKMGFDIALMELPFHGKRLTPEFREIGHNFFPGSNLFLTNEGLLQAISDLRQLRMILKALGCKDIGCIGISLGAYLASLWCALDPISFCVPMVPLASMSEVMTKSIEEKRPELLQGKFQSTLDDALRIHMPTSYVPKTDGDKILIIAGHEDVIIPKSHPELLSKHFNSNPVIWFTGDHQMSQDRDFIFNSILTFFREKSIIS